MPSTVTDPDRQDLINCLLAAALNARATQQQTQHTAALMPPEEHAAAADLAEAVHALGRIRDALLQAADVLNCDRR
ncbi:thioredoxin-like negative regulator of GroEL [Actinoplanes octamycinicus]|uniref:Thioredoxin-like negative regulator of GroEL n=1 Tax=Actinoplanes octamycinicus TaxID=135948 RepID=A0A7W7MBG2_9ACTN|nr:hypothetical protein [Actinoplanes octamycinicus]MBB4743987.1 thioredoxin-like negative regulator of GroEL [Actinoplanes octamycinicus]